MVTIQAKNSRGHKYWYIVESRRVNKKPRPIVLEYLGKANDLLSRLQGLTEGIKLKSYSHGTVAVFLNIVHQLDFCSIINKHIKSTRDYISEKPVRNNLTAGITFLLAAVGRIAQPTSKRSWWEWAKTTSLQYLLRHSLSKVDSQHFWDMMDSLPIEAIPEIESELLKKVIGLYSAENEPNTLANDTLLIDASNFYTYIATTNERCTIAQRGKNKQKRGDLRQVGLIMVVSRIHMIPVFHHTYQGNMNDSKVFKEVIGKIKNRMTELNLDFDRHTVVFDRGNNSRKNMDMLKELNLHYVGALTPYHHKALIQDAVKDFEEVQLEDSIVQAYRDKRVIWGEERTVIVFVSDRLKEGQIRGIYQNLKQAEKQLQQLQESLVKPRVKKQTRVQVEKRVLDCLTRPFSLNLMDWALKEVAEGKFQLEFSINQSKLSKVEDDMGFRIIMSDRHHWNTADIIKAYNGQSAVEHAFKNIKNPYHLTLKPQFHWTDQKIIVHYFICVIGYLFSTIAWKQAKEKAEYTGTLDNFLDLLNNIRLGTILEESNKRGKVKAIYKLEEMSKQESKIVDALNVKNFHNNPPKIKDVGVYN